MKIRKGFTLIELLVVIAIIGILSSVVLASLNTARAKGADAAIKADLGQVRPQAEIYYDSNSDYAADASSCTDAGSLFVVDQTVANAVADAATKSGSTATCYSDDGVLGAGSAASSWAVSVPLKSTPTVSWCVDYTGIATTGAATLTSNVAACQ
ncbi:prepilin-type N-terminal cleavage/methylation domain-containing protein [Patescibacteria group bacterium]|nr:MAG: prepilin-type N-terminal cleavage/methylation domain-containing protein [Patescibacteria group bacterium]